LLSEEDVGIFSFADLSNFCVGFLDFPLSLCFSVFVNNNGGFSDFFGPNYAVYGFSGFAN